MSNYYDNQKLSQQDRQNHIEMVKKSFPKQPSVETKIEEILKENFEYVILQRNSEFCIQGEDFNDIKEIYRATEELLALFSTQQAQIEKAFGGCRKCYGKGYSTWRHGETYRGKTSNMRNDIKFCDCERGEQLQDILESQQAQMMDKINSAIDNVKYMKFFSSSRALEELRDDVLNIIGGSDE